MRTRIVILAAGEGKRMKSNLPKVLAPLRGKPLLRYVLNAVEASGIDSQPVIVVGVKADMVKAQMGNNCIYVHQAEQLGTGHAVRCAETALKIQADAVMVLYGDQPFVTSETIKNLVSAHETGGATITMLTCELPDFNDWRKGFYDFGRIARDPEGNIACIIEAKDATPGELQIKEVNPAYYCFNAAWLWEHLDMLETHNSQGEYYITDLVQIAIQEGKRIASFPMNPKEAFGMNTPEHMALGEQLVF